MLTGADTSIGIIIGTVIVVIYAAMGGMKSVVANDVIHFCVLIVALPLVLFFGLKQAGGVPAVLHAVPSDHVSFLDHYLY